MYEAQNTIVSDCLVGACEALDLCPMWESRIDGLGLRRYSAHVKSQREAAMQQAGSSSAASSGQPTLPKGSRGVTQSYGAGHPVPKAEV